MQQLENRVIVRTAEAGTIAICFVAAALEPVRTRGLDADGLLRAVDLRPSLLKSPQARVTAKQFGALWRLVAQTLDDEFFGQDSRRMKVGSFAMLCHAVVHCESLAQALERSCRFYDLIFDDIGASLRIEGAQAKIVLRERRRGEPPRIFAHETLLMLLHGVACWLVGRRLPIESAHFGYAEPAHSAEYRLMYSTNLRFDGSETCVAFDARCLELPIVQDEASVKEFLRHAPENILVKYKNAGSLGAKIRHRLRQSLPAELPEFDALANEMHMTPVTMRRRLHDEGATYQAIKDQLRRDLAIDYLSHSRRSVLDIALQLGFTERSAFHRAFRKWTGASPGEFRRNSAG
jgi:AraC-like DNA-binding protein